MKITTKLSSCLSALIVTTPLILSPSLYALEKPSKEIDPVKENGREAEMAEKKAPAPARKIAMLGVGGNPASDILSLHLGLAENTGLTLYHVVPGSAAAEAGIKNDDIITAINDVAIGSQEDLREAVISHKPGDEVTVKLVQRGKAVEKKVTLGGRALPGRGMGVPERGIHEANGLLKMFRGMGGNVPEADRKRAEAEMQKRMDEIRKQFKNGDRLQFGDAIPMNLGALKMGKGIQMLGGSTAIIQDNDGSITMKSVNGKKEVIVKDKAGETVFEGPYDTEQDKAAVPDDIAHRIKRVDIDMGGNNRDLELELKVK